MILLPEFQEQLWIGNIELSVDTKNLFMHESDNSLQTLNNTSDFLGSEPMEF